MAGGRPTKYKKEYCALLVEHMKSGLSFESFAGLVKVSFDTIHEWVRVHPEFSAAKKAGVPQSLMFWEKLGRAGTAGQVKNFNVAAWIFNMKNRFRWRDTFEIDTSDGNGNVRKIELSYKLDSDKP